MKLCAYDNFYLLIDFFVCLQYIFFCAHISISTHLSPQNIAPQLILSTGPSSAGWSPSPSLTVYPGVLPDPLPCASSDPHSPSSTVCSKSSHPPHSDPRETVLCFVTRSSRRWSRCCCGGVGGTRSGRSALRLCCTSVGKFRRCLLLCERVCLIGRVRRNSFNAG